MSKYRHECPDWDYLEIDESMTEFGCCTCEFDGEAHEIRQAHMDALDEYNESQDLL
jgi:hypothetical protein